MPILVSMSGEACKSSLVMNTLRFKQSSSFQIKPKFVWSIISFKKHISQVKTVLNFMR